MFIDVTGELLPLLLFVVNEVEKTGTGLLIIKSIKAFYDSLRA